MCTVYSILKLENLACSGIRNDEAWQKKLKKYYIATEYTTRMSSYIKLRSSLRGLCQADMALVALHRLSDRNIEDKTVGLVMCYISLEKIT